MRWLYLLNDFGIPWSGGKGASIHVRSMAGAFVAQGDVVEVAARRVDPGCAASLPAGVSLSRLPDTAPPTSASFSPAAVDRSVREWIEARHAVAPFDAIYERHALWTVAGLDAARRLGVPHVLEVNAPLADEAARWRRLPAAVAAAEAERRLAREADRLVAVSPGVADHLLALGADPRRVSVEPNGVADAILDLPRRSPREPGAPFVIGFVGSLKPWHGVDTLLDGFARLRGEDAGWALRVVGDGPLAGTLRARAAGTPGITWTGARAHAELGAELAVMDAGAALYETGVGGYVSPLKIVEYQAAGLPVVASGGAGVAASIDHGEAGLLVPAGDAAAAAAAFRRLRDEPMLVDRLSAAGRRRAASRRWIEIARRVRDSVVAAAGAGSPT